MTPPEGRRSGAGVVAVTRRTFKPAAVLPVRRRQQLELGEGAASGTQLSFGRRDERAGDAAPLVRLAYRESAPLAHPLSRGQAVLRHTQIELHAADHLASAVGVAGDIFTGTACTLVKLQGHDAPSGVVPSAGVWLGLGEAMPLIDEAPLGANGFEELSPV